MESALIRQAFLEFFKRQNHTVEASGPLVPKNDPTLMFVNAGMAPFKNVFTGLESRADRRATSSQKCIRISGKHNDLENVGVTARHHTFFEMLGNFSFGDYFKEDAIRFAWQFLVEEMKLDTSRLVVTVFGGAAGYGEEDIEAARLWRSVTGFGDDRIIRCGPEENFWSMGDTGPCGPSTEIHYFLGDGSPNISTFGEEPDESGAGWFEIWNLVFMQFDRQADGSLENLPAPSVDTGMGLERLAVVKQGVLSNYDTDLLRPIVMLAAELSKKNYSASQKADDISMRVIADHARTAAFLISEGVFPDKDGRSYVLRRVMRRAIRHGHRLGLQENFFWQCALKVCDLMQAAYPQLAEHRELIEQICQTEETLFRRTLNQGLQVLNTNQDWLETPSGKTLPGALAWKLSDTWGFPLDLQRVIGAENGFVIDEAGYQTAREAARALSRGSKVGSQKTADIYYQLQSELTPSTFVGYEKLSLEAEEIVALVNEQTQVDSLFGSADNAQIGQVVLKTTPFYPEKGGQVGDRGQLVADGHIFEVVDTQTPVEGLIVHSIKRPSHAHALKVGDKVTLKVSRSLRSATRRNHSATHLLHWALRETLGSTVTQKGSLVGPTRLRFDYSASAALSSAQIEAIENMVNQTIVDNTQAQTEVMNLDQAKKSGAIGIFDEKYGQNVRVLTIGESKELCGGTHVARTGDIGAFRIVSDSNLAAGVRRIEANTGLNTIDAHRESDRALSMLAAKLKTPTSELARRVENLLDENKRLAKEKERLQLSVAQAGFERGGNADGLGETDHGAFVSLVKEVPEVDPKALRQLVDTFRDKLQPAVVVVGTQNKGKALLACSVSKELVDVIKAGAVIRDIASVVGGGGGGRPDFAQAGGPNAAALGDALARASEIIEAVAEGMPRGS